MKDIPDQMRLSNRMITLLVAELRASGCEPLSIASMLCKAAAKLIHEVFEPENARLIITRAAEVMMKHEDC